MGIGYKLSGCSASSSTAPAPPNPDPKNYRIINTMLVGNFVIVRAVYPTCKAFEKNKTLVYGCENYPYLKRCTMAPPRKRPPLDPHFCDSEEHPSPIARFQPGKEGLKMAVAFCRHYKEEEEI